MDCASCARKISDAIGGLPGVTDVSVALMSERLRLRFDPAQIEKDRIEQVVRSLGFGITQNNGSTSPRRGLIFPLSLPVQKLSGFEDSEKSLETHPAPDLPNESHWYQTTKSQFALLTGTFGAIAWGVKFFMPGPIGSMAFVVACLCGLVPIARHAWAALRLGQPFTIESLMTFAAAGALTIGASEEAALVIFLFAIGEVLEGIAANRARDGIRALTRLVPKTAFVELDGQLREIPVDQLSIGQIVYVRPGDRIPADGEIINGTGGIDESPVTGESMPRTRGPSESVFAGSIVTDTTLQIQVTKTTKENTIARIIRLIEEAEETRAPTERFIDRFGRWYMPFIVGLSIIVIIMPPLVTDADWQTWIYRGLTLLLIGCPCALVISVPASIASALSSGARRGLLLKGGVVIEALASVSQVAFDKTGTLTHGRPQVTDIIAIDRPEEEVLRLTAAIETGSNHPIAKAIFQRAEGISIPRTHGAKTIPGKGVTADVEGETLTVASPRHAVEKGVLSESWIRCATALEGEGKTVVVLFTGSSCLGLIALRDELRIDAIEAVAQLRALGIVPTVLTGDNSRTAAAIAASIGTEFHAEMLPVDKLAFVSKMAVQGGIMMVGDGINDAPALKQATVGIAMGSGTDVALETADGAILRNRITDIPATIRLARATMSNIHQNIAIALGLKLVFLVTSIFGLTGLWIAVLADTGATVLVTLNALRLLIYHPEKV